MENAILRVFKLQHAGTCTGMFWRRNPLKGKSTFGENPEWPRNGALLKGIIHDFAEKPEHSQHWLEVKEYQQAGTSTWVGTPEDCWMQFEQEGPLLHEVK